MNHHYTWCISTSLVVAFTSITSHHQLLLLIYSSGANDNMFPRESICWSLCYLPIQLPIDWWTDILQCITIQPQSTVWKKLWLKCVHNWCDFRGDISKHPEKWLRAFTKISTLNRSLHFIWWCCWSLNDRTFLMSRWWR